MPATSLWGVTPRQSIEAACRRTGKAHVVRGCVDLLGGREVDPELVRSLGGPRATQDGSPLQGYWLRVWAARGLLWAWDDTATAAIVHALSDESWRVREMAARTVARHRVDAALGAVAALQSDPVPRVRSAAARALRRLTEQSQA